VGAANSTGNESFQAAVPPAKSAGFSVTPTRNPEAPNKCYLVVSAIFPEFEARIFPDVEQMVASFQIKEASQDSALCRRTNALVLAGC
jgi:hypothetical protein